MRRGRVMLAAVCAALVLGCGAKTGEVLTADFEGRRVQAFQIEGVWLLYVWAAANRQTEPTQLVLRNLHSGSEQVLDPDWRGGTFALHDRRVAWWSRREADDTGVAPFYVRPATAAKPHVVARGAARSLDLSADVLVWDEHRGDRSAIMMVELPSGAPKELAVARGDRQRRVSQPLISGDRIVWLDYDGPSGMYALKQHDRPSGLTSGLGVMHDQAFQFEMSGDEVVFTVGTGGTRELHRYDFGRQEDHIIATGERLTSYVAVENGTIAWAERIAEEDYKPVPGQPLMGPGDFHNIYRYSVDSGTTTCLAENVLTIPPHIGVAGGKVYVTVYRELPPPGETNLIVPIDLLRW